jgi:serine/threonine protein kinase
MTANRIDPALGSHAGGADARAEDPRADDPRVVELADEYLRELEAGRRPDRASYCARYPELAEIVAECLEGLDLVRSGIASARPAAEASLPAEPIGRLASPLGDFQIVREIAQGGMGVVYEAVQLSLGRRVALKVLPFAATLDSRRLQRFKIEAQAAALLHHTHIVPIYAIGCERGVHFYAMQLIEGQSLAVVIEQLRREEHREPRTRGTGGSKAEPQPPELQLTESLSPAGPSRGPVFPPAESRPPRSDEASRSTLDRSVAAVTSGAKLASEAYIRRIARLMVQAADALEHAHQAGVIHRDIKPGNLLVDAAANLWVTDFGLAQLQADNGLTRSGDFLGTFRYMSPEQTSGQRTMLDHRTDIYSLGATFYELLTLEPVVPGETHQELLYDILHTEPKSLRHWNRAVPPELETIVLKALAKSPAERFQSAAELSADIQRYLDHKPIHARPPTLLDRVRKWSRRHPSVAIAGVLLLGVIAVASLVSNRMIAREQAKTSAALDREKDRAREAEERFQQARQAVDALFQISQEELSDKPSDAARKRILEVVVSYYQDFIDERRGDPTAQAELARVQNEVKEILAELVAVQREMQTRLLASQGVQRELQLSHEQETELDAILAEWSQERGTFFSQLRGLSEEERRQQLLATAEAHEAVLAGLLTPAQIHRYKQIAIQWQGLAAFKEPEIVKALALSSEQRSQIREIERETFFRPFGQGGPGRMGPGGPPPHERPPHERLPRDRQHAIAQVLDLLSTEQRATWQELTGPEFWDFGDGPPGMFGPPGPEFPLPDLGPGPDFRPPRRR